LTGPLDPEITERLRFIQIANSLALDELVNAARACVAHFGGNTGWAALKLADEFTHLHGHRKVATICADALIRLVDLMPTEPAIQRPPRPIEIEVEPDRDLE
jgi:hypothetical protein